MLQVNNTAMSTDFPKDSFKMFREYKHLAKEFYSGRMFVAFDTETTGLHKDTDFLIEVGAVKFNCNGLVGEKFSALIKPPVPILELTTQITGITNEMVSSAPEASLVLQEFLRYINSNTTMLVAHNAPFDLGFLNAQLHRMNFQPIKNLCIDTLPLARWAYPDFGKEEIRGQYKLQSLAKRFGIDPGSAHRACDDARVCMELFLKCLKDSMPSQIDYEIHSEPGNLSSQESQLELF